MPDFGNITEKASDAGIEKAGDAVDAKTGAGHAEQGDKVEDVADRKIGEGRVRLRARPWPHGRDAGDRHVVRPGRPGRCAVGGPRRRPLWQTRRRTTRPCSSVARATAL